MKLKKVNYRIVEDGHDAWRILDEAIDYHESLVAARIGLAWKNEVKEDVDGLIMLGRCKKVADLEKEFHPFDFIIVLNREAWAVLSEKQRLALVDHELCHAEPKLDQDSCEQIEDVRGRKVWRIRKHDIEEFREVVQRHGCYKADIQRFAEALLSGKKAQEEMFHEPDAAK